MSLQDFWDSVRTGIRGYSPKRLISDSPRFDADAVEGFLENAETWLRPAAVRGYNRADFDFLPDDERDRLTAAVDEFRGVVSGIDPRRPALPEQEQAARPLFRTIVEMLEFDRFADAEAYRVGKTIESNWLFPHDDVIDIRYRTTTDSNREPALKMMTYLPDSDDPTFLARAKVVRKAIQDLVFELGQPYWPYVSTRLIGEFADLPALGADE